MIMVGKILKVDFNLKPFMEIMRFDSVMPL